MLAMCAVQLILNRLVQYIQLAHLGLAVIGLTGISMSGSDCGKMRVVFLVPLQADSPRLSDRLLSLLLQKGLAPALIATPAYSQMIEHMLTETAHELPSWDTVVSQLVAAGNIAEAGTTLLLQMGVSPALAVFSAALALAKETSPEE
jgi:hypothetical protein